MNQVRESEVDGVRCFWVETGRPTLAARLAFRFGMVDEAFVESGWQHLLEHLALEGRGGGALQVNGSISLLQTAFDAHGPAEAVTAQLDSLTAWLSEPVLDRVEHESKVLRAEAALRGADPVSEALTWRYGAAGPGLASYHGPAIGRASPPLLADRAARTLTRDNAALVLDGPPPAGLRLHLPEGALLPVPAARPCVPDGPAAYVTGAGVVVSGVVRRSVTMRLAHGLLQQALRDDLRTGAGAAYAPWVSYEPVDAEHCLVAGGSDVGEELMSTIANRTLQLVRKLRAFAPEEDRLEEARAAYLQGLADPFHQMGIALAAAERHLHGQPPHDVAELAGLARAVTGRQVRDAFEEMHASLLLGVPSEASWERPVPMLHPELSTAWIRGRGRRSANWPADAARLHVEEHGLAVTEADEARAVPYESLAGVLTYDDGVRVLVQRDGFVLGVEPTQWRRGATVIAELDRRLDPGLLLAQPPLRGAPAARASAARRWWLGVCRWLRPWSASVWIVGVIAVLAVLGLLVG